MFYPLPGNDYNVMIELRNKAVGIKNDSNLKNYLENSGDSPSDLASSIKNYYYYNYRKPLNIETDSLAIEILGHVYPQEVAEYVNGISWVPQTVKDWLNNVLERTSVIDAGEEDVDSNRWIWDTIASLLDALTNIIFI